jgi:hypothetical protein
MVLEAPLGLTALVFEAAIDLEPAFPKTPKIAVSIVRQKQL